VPHDGCRHGHSVLAHSIEDFTFRWNHLNVFLIETFGAPVTLRHKSHSVMKR
jgi:hypothetical protein